MIYVLLNLIKIFFQRFFHLAEKNISLAVDISFQPAYLSWQTAFETVSTQEYPGIYYKILDDAAQISSPVRQSGT